MATFNAYSTPILLITEKPSANVYIDDRIVQFKDGTAVLHPWKWSYIVRVHDSGKSTIRSIYPWDQASDSGSIEVGKDGEVVFNIANEPVSK